MHQGKFSVPPAAIEQALAPDGRSPLSLAPMQNELPRDTFEPFARGVAQSGVRIANERAVMTLIALNPGASNADLARLSGLGPQTTSRIVADLEGRSLIRRGDVLRGRRGQPATPLFLDPEGAFSIGVEVGWRHVEVLLFSMAGKTLASVRRSYCWPDAATIVGIVGAEIATIRAGMTAKQARRLAGIGLATPSSIHRNIGRLGASAEAATRWQDFDLATRIAQMTDQPVTWFNDGNAGCWSELIARPAPRPQGFAYIQVGTMIGAGMVLGGELWEGPTGNGANLGSILVTDEAGKSSYVHLEASLLSLEQRLAAADLPRQLGNPINWNWAGLEPVASAWIDAAGLAIAKAVISASGLIGLDTAVVDGVMPRPVVQRLVESVRAHMAALPPFSGQQPKLEMGANGAAAPAMGAAQLVLFRAFFSRAWNIFAA